MTWQRLVTAGTLLSLVAGCDLAGDSGTAKVLGSVDVPAGEHRDDVSTVNGSVHIGQNAVVGRAHTVNGNVFLEAHASAAELHTVNGSVALAQSARVSGNVRTVNGKLTLESGAEVIGALENVNGLIRVAAAHVAGGINTVAGSMELGPNAHVEGGLHIEKPSGTSLLPETIPRVIIMGGTVVAGTLNFERPVKLYVSDKATIGPVEGATPVKFSGELPTD
jgi:cytoskeletal protein CcmA (bactofilin family)